MPRCSSSQPGLTVSKHSCKLIPQSFLRVEEERKGGNRKRLALNVRLGNAALTQELETSLSQVNDLAFVLLLSLGIGNLAVRDAANVLDDVVGLADLADQGLVFGFKQLQKRPHGNVLEGGVSRLEEATEVPVDAAVGLVPVLNKDGVVADWQSSS